ncbi:hypothetical protein U1Q18_018270 [Sarracenia purpurea var. burkii]
MRIKEEFSYFGKKLQRLCSRLRLKLVCYFRSTCFLIWRLYRHFRLRLNSLSVHLIYFISISFLGFWILKVLKPRTAGSFKPRNLDLFFTSVSAATVSSMSTVEMEVFSNTQLLILILLMFIGGEVFTSMVELHIRRFNLRRIIRNTERKIDRSSTGIINPSSSPPNSLELIELGIVVTEVDCLAKTTPDHNNQIEVHRRQMTTVESTSKSDMEDLDSNLKYNSIKLLSFVVMGYLLVINFVGVALVSVYLALVSSARNILKKKGLKLFTFSLFTVVSTFASCGFVPTNENMMVFRKNSGLLLILIPQVLLGNTLFPPFLRFSIWFFGKFVKKVRPSSDYLLAKTGDIGYHHLLPGLHSSLLVGTVVGFIGVQFTLFCSMEWDSVALSGLSSYQKVVGVLFESVNSRHTGETIVDLSTIASAILVLFVVMM